MTKTKWKVAATAAFLLLLLAGKFAWFNLMHYHTVLFPPVADSVMPSDCKVENPVAVDIKAEAAKIEALATIVTPNWARVDSDPQIHAKAAELADTLHRLSRSNYVYCSGGQWPPRGMYSSLTFVAEQIRYDQGMGLFSSFPEISIFGNIYTGEPALIEFWHRSKDGVDTELGWSPDPDSSDVLTGWIGQTRTPNVRGSYCDRKDDLRAYCR